MKSPLLALTLISSSALFGAYHDTDNANYNESDNCSPCCTPCCTPEPKKCIDCECYTPKYYDLQCDWGLFVSGDFLYWYARETHLSYAAVLSPKEYFQENPATPPFMELSSVEAFGVSWDPGFRVGIGYNWRCDGWDTYLNWTSFCNSRSDSVSVPTLTDPGVIQGLVANPWTHVLNFGASAVTQAIYWTSVAAKWSLRFNQLDLELGRKYWLSPCFSLRPYTGLRGQWIKTTLKSTSSVDSTIPTDDGTLPPISGMDELSITDKASNGGFLVGIQPNWYFCSNFILYSNFSTSLTWGKYESKHDESFTYLNGEVASTGETVSTDPKSTYRFYGMLATLDLGIGLRWEENWCCDRYKTSLDLGWEHHLLFDYNHRIQINQNASNINIGSFGVAASGLSGTSGSDYSEAGCTLSMGGFVLRARFDF